MIRPSLLSFAIGVACFSGYVHAQINPQLTPPSSVGWVPNVNGGGSHVFITSHGTMQNMPNGNLSAFLESPGLKDFGVRAGGLLPVGSGSSARVVPVTLVGKVTSAGVLKAVGTLAGAYGGLPVIAASVAIPLIYDWIKQSSLAVNPDGSFSKLSKDFDSICPPHVSEMANCNAWYGGGCTLGFSGGWCAAMTSSNQVGVWIGAPIATANEKRTPISLPEALGLMASVQPDPGVIKEIFTIDQTGQYSDQLLKDLSIQNVVASGPATVSGPSSSSVTPATETSPEVTTTKKIDYSCSYVLADVSCLEKETTTQQKTGIDPATGQPYPKAETGITTKENQPDPAPIDSALPPLPKLYTPKYPGGITGLWTEKKALLMASPMLSLIPDLMPRLGSSGGYPSFPIPVVIGQWNFGTYDVSPASYVWDFIKFCVLVTTAFFVRAVIFGG